MHAMRTFESLSSVPRCDARCTAIVFGGAARICGASNVDQTSNWEENQQHECDADSRAEEILVDKLRKLDMYLYTDQEEDDRHQEQDEGAPVTATQTAIALKRFERTKSATCRVAFRCFEGVCSMLLAVCGQQELRVAWGPSPDILQKLARSKRGHTSQEFNWPPRAACHSHWQSKKFS